jgi:hypothetical protein
MLSDWEQEERWQISVTGTAQRHQQLVRSVGRVLLLAVLFYTGIAMSKVLCSDMRLELPDLVCIMNPFEGTPYEE